MNNTQNKITVIGMGYIGLPTALLLAHQNRNIICIDNDKKKIKDFKIGKSFLKEKEINLLFKKKRKLLNFSEKIELSNTYIICVPTPVKKYSKYLYKEDLSILNSVFNNLEKILKKNDLVIIESTCPPETALNFYNKIKKKFNFYLATCPERAMPGNTINEMVNNYRVIGASCKETFKKAKKLYQLFVKGKIYKTDLTEAELIKLFENSYRDVNIGFANEIDTICKKYLIDSKKIIKLTNFHPRVKIHEPGIGVGGHCIPVDPWFLIEKRNTLNNSIIYNSRISNLKKEDEIYNNLSKILNKKAKILFFGTTYKKNTEDMRNSPAINLINRLIKVYSQVKIFDPINQSHNNIKLKKVKSISFDMIIIFVKHDWLKKNKLKSKNIISL